MKRRDFIKGSLAGGTLALSGFIPINRVGNLRRRSLTSARGGSKRVIFLGIDGMDPSLTRSMMADGLLPNFSKLKSQGHFGPLGTTLPPQSPVAWSSFITGCNPGQHGIYDFIHRDPKTMMPYLSTC